MSVPVPISQESTHKLMGVSCGCHVSFKDNQGVSLKCEIQITPATLLFSTFLFAPLKSMILIIVFDMAIVIVVAALQHACPLELHSNS